MSMKLLYTGHDRIFIDRIRQALAQADIPCFIRNESLMGQAAGEVPPVVAWPEVFVKDETNFLVAKALMEGLQANVKTNGIAWICPNCSERLEPQFLQCWACQAIPEDQ